MVKTLHARLVAYLPNGGRLGNLPAPLSWDASIVNNDLGALKVVYSRRTVGGGILKRGLEQGLEIGLEVSDGGTWSEPYNCRYLLIGRSRNAEDVSDTVTLTCQSRPIGTFVVLITVARPCGSRRVGLSFLSRGK